MASTASGGVGLMAIAWLATRRISDAELGFFFSFLSFGALVQLADFGLSFAALQTAGRLAGTARLHELPAVARRVRRWNLATTTVAVLVVAGIGWMIFSARTPGGESSPISWRYPWMAYLASVFGAQLTNPGISLREGAGKVSQMWRLRLVQEWISAAACFVALHAGAGLWSLAVFALARAVVGGSWLLLGDPLRSTTRDADYSLERWMSEVWPFQWKLGLSMLSGFLIFRALTPIVLLERGPILAGQFGLAVSIMNLLITVSSAWPSSQAARYSAMHGAGHFARLRREFPLMLWSSTAVSAVAAVVLTIVLWRARELGVTFALRLPEIPTTALILSAAVVHHFVACFAMFLRSEGREPLLVPSIAGATFTVAAIWLTAHYFDLRDIAIVNLACALIGIPVVLLLLRSRQRQLLAVK